MKQSEKRSMHASWDGELVIAVPPKSYHSRERQLMEFRKLAPLKLFRSRPRLEPKKTPTGKKTCTQFSSSCIHHHQK